MVDVNSDIEMKSPRVNLVIDRDRAAALQLNASDIETALYNGFGPKWSSTIYGPKAQYKVLLELDPEYQEHADTLETIAFKSHTNALVPLAVGRGLPGGRRAAVRVSRRQTSPR